MVIFEHETLMERLAGRRPIFHSEADFQHELAFELRKMCPDVQVRLEFPAGQADRSNIDVLVRKGNAKFGLELKYLCCAYKQVAGDEEFQLRHHGACDLRRYDVCKDIWRIEKFCQKNRGATGGVLILTNDPAYWKSRRRTDTNDAAFSLTDGCKLQGTLHWEAGTEAKKGKGRKDALALAGCYSIKWCDYFDFNDKFGKLRYLYIEIEPKKA